MEWRCEWCGKPHEDDDPPCDSCGHGSFERAVVQQAPAGESTTLWVCTECGREHPKHNPPCSRCGKPDLERRERTVDDAELTPPGYLDLLTPRYALGLAVALVLAAVLVLGLAGVVDLPGMDDRGVPEVEDVPGSAESVDGTALSAIEASYVDRYNERRADEGAPDLERDDQLAAIAAFVNRRQVRADAGEDAPADRERVEDLLAGPCGRSAGVPPTFVDRPPDGAGSAGAIGGFLADRQFERFGASVPAERGLIGVDVHAAPDGRLYVTQITC